ncbi:hypothetical protein L1887_56039 [Cichorium endivia]|nr:hypothetical protein L1887_56039 [Cichorium endivia]
MLRTFGLAPQTAPQPAGANAIRRRREMHFGPTLGTAIPRDSMGGAEKGKHVSLTVIRGTGAAEAAVETQITIDQQMLRARLQRTYEAQCWTGGELSPSFVGYSTPSVQASLSEAGGHELWISRV